MIRIIHIITHIPSLLPGTWRPVSFYDRVKYNREGGMHTLCLLDIKVRAPQ